ncbi:hypothetical protein AMATHDRAFT_145028, partial [Amanita thiersii Skay4041]
MSLADVLERPSLRTDKARDVFHTILGGRKCWKAQKSGEIVWPPELEAALLEGLEHYIPKDSRETRLLGRFPLRNQFISQYILERTGKKRTAKQVGSRLQQLRDTCGNKRLLSLLSPYPRPTRHTSMPPSPISSWYPMPPRISDENGEASSSALPITQNDTNLSETDSLVEDDRSKSPGSVHCIYIDILPNHQPTSSHSLADALGCEDPTDPVPYLSTQVNQIQISQQPRHLRSIDPTLTFLSPNAISARSVFTIYTKGKVFATEVTTLTTAGPKPSADCSNDGLLYRTSLVPRYWETISNNPTMYLIEQKVYQDTPAMAASLLFSAIYKFRF